MILFDMAQPTNVMNKILSLNCTDDLFLRVMSEDFNSTHIVSDIRFLPTEYEFYEEAETDFIGIDWNIYEAPACYNVQKEKLNNMFIPYGEWQNASAFITVPFYLIPERITYFEYWLENCFNIPIDMNNLNVEYFDSVGNMAIRLRYGLKNTAIMRDNKHLFIGSFARVSDGWKFYPRLQFHDKLGIKGV